MPRTLPTWALLAGVLAGPGWALPAGQPAARDALALCRAAPGRRDLRMPGGC